MVLKLINATEARNGTAVIINNEPSIVRSVDVSKTGKHGHAKVRLEAIGIFDNKKKIIVVPGHERFEVPEIKKLKGQILSIQGENASIMDLETFETFDVLVPENLREILKENDNVEYWDVEGKRIIKRKL